MTQVLAFACENCGFPVASGALVCARCGAFVYRRALEQLAAEALRNESSNPRLAAHVWRQSLPMLPPNSPQFRTVVDRSAVLEGFGSSGAHGGFAPPVERADDDERRIFRQPDELHVAVFKTLGSMLLSILIYAVVYMVLPTPFIQTRSDALVFAIGFTSLMLVHELGHSIALRKYNLSASPPIFIPFLGAVINMRQPPRNAKEEAIVGIAGPLLGTAGALLCALLLWTPWAGDASSYHDVVGTVAFFGIVLNLVNLLPVPPLDGGRVTAALSPWIWLLGLAGLVWLVWFLGTGYIMLALIIATGLPRIVQTLGRRGLRSPYYNVKRRDAWTIGAVYVGLAITLALMLIVLRSFNPFQFT